MEDEEESIHELVMERGDLFADITTAKQLDGMRRLLVAAEMITGSSVREATDAANDMLTMMVVGGGFTELLKDQAEWSQETFGSDKDRGPLGALKHLELEAREAQATPGDIEEYADCLLLLLDANRRAGWDILQLIAAATGKLEKNKAREWSKPTSDEPVRHVIRRHGSVPIAEPPKPVPSPLPILETVAPGEPLPTPEKPKKRKKPKGKTCPPPNPSAPGF